jgi:zinc protease
MRKPCCGALCLAVLLGTSSVHAGPKVQTWMTDNGAKVMFYPAPELPMLDVRATFAAGSVRDAGHAGIARLTNGLLAEGAAGLDAQGIAERFERAGARYSNRSLREMAWVALRTLSDPAMQQPALDTFVQVLTRPDFNPADVERVRKQMLSALDQLEQSPSRIAKRAFYRTLYADHPYANTPAGDRESLAAIDVAAIRQFYKRYYVTRNVTLAIVGDVDHQQARRIAQRIADGLSVGERAPAVPQPPALTDARTVRVSFPSRQSHILMGAVGMSRDDPDYFDLYVANHVFGGSGFASRLLTTIRERNGLAYSAYSYFQPMAERGPFLMGVQTRSEQAGKAVELAQRELEQYVTSGASADELLASQRNITGGFALRIDSNRKLLEYLTTIGYYDLPLDYLDSFSTHVEAVSVGSMREALKARIDPGKLITVIVGEGAG